MACRLQLAALCLLWGCGPQRHVEAIPVPVPGAGGFAVATFPSELRGAYVRNHQVCAEPFSDTAANSTLDLAAKLSKTAQISAEAASDTGAGAGSTAALEGSLKATTEVVQLAGRTQAVLITRELLFRLCEANLNGTVDKAQAVELYTQAFAIVKDISTADKSQSQARAFEAERDALAAKERVMKTSGSVLACLTVKDGCTAKATDDAGKALCEAQFQDCTKKAKAP